MKPNLNTLNFKHVFSRLNLLHNVSIESVDEWIEIALIGWNMIGNKELEYVTYENLPVVDSKVEIPCSFYKIEAVTRGSDNIFYYHDSVTHDNNQFNPYHTRYSGKVNLKDIREINGEYIPYTLYPDYILITHKNNVDSLRCVNILISTVKLDCDGLPYLTEREVNALIDYCLLVHYQKTVTLGKPDYNYMNYLNLKWNKSCRNARVSQTMTQNFIDSMLNIHSSFDVKQYNRSYKLYKDV